MTKESSCPHPRVHIDPGAEGNQESSCPRPRVHIDPGAEGNQREFLSSSTSPRVHITTMTIDPSSPSPFSWSVTSIQSRDHRQEVRSNSCFCALRRPSTSLQHTRFDHRDTSASSCPLARSLMLNVMLNLHFRLLQSLFCFALLRFDSIVVRMTPFRAARRLKYCRASPHLALCKHCTAGEAQFW